MTKFLIWSNQKAAWWRPNHHGYTYVIDEAGRYDRATAEEIVRDATLGGELRHQRTDPVTGRVYDMLDEVMVVAPETEK